MSSDRVTTGTCPTVDLGDKVWILMTDQICASEKQERMQVGVWIFLNLCTALHPYKQVTLQARTLGGAQFTTDILTGGFDCWASSDLMHWKSIACSQGYHGSIRPGVSTVDDDARFVFHPRVCLRIGVSLSMICTRSSDKMVYQAWILAWRNLHICLAKEHARRLHQSTSLRLESKDDILQYQ